MDKSFLVHIRSFLLTIFFLSSVIPLQASKYILVDLTHQIAIAYEDGRIKFFGRISSGKPGRDTPTGSYYVREKDIDHISNLWPKPNGGAKMHYMLRITRDGVAMHLGNTPDYPASHGCIRMQNGFAQRMYAWASKRTPVDIIGKAPAHSPAVALPPYARSKRILMRSIRGGTGNPLAILSANPKVNKRERTLFNTSASQPKRRHTHVDPLSVLSRHSSKKAQRPHSRISHRHKRKSRKKRNRHPNPLKAVAGL